MIFLSVYAISDLHLSFGSDKPMDIFKGWENHCERIKANWNRLVKMEDTVILPGDFSWALKLEDTKEDFLFLDSLNGQKIILKGNHDLWWGTKTKILQFFEKNEIKTVRVLFNDAFLVEGLSICGSRGWFYDNKDQSKKIILREANRLETSIKEGIKLGGELTVFLHYPPVYKDYVCGEILETLKKYDIKTVFHGHIHGAPFHNATDNFDGIDFKLISCDCIDFTPLIIKK